MYRAGIILANTVSGCSSFRTKRESRQESQRYKLPRGSFGLPEPSGFFVRPKSSHPQGKQIAADPWLPVEIPLCDLFPAVFLVMRRWTGGRTVVARAGPGAP
jgi:hypothetical protein